MSEFWDSEQLLGKMVKNSREEVYIKKVEKKGKQYIDIRTFWFDGNSDEFRPSQKGITIPYESIKEFKDIIASIE
ncbi:MAG: transcriptional coactivator p15/PC4 family protein [Clostridia bacterium]|nr:transcriptional coactivator p15/PC4 family protein [Clostridia bacterium]